MVAKAIVDNYPHWYDWLTDERYEPARQLFEECDELRERISDLESSNEDMHGDFQEIYANLSAIDEVQSDDVSLKKEVSISVGDTDFEAEVSVEVTLYDVAKELNILHNFHHAHDAAGRW